LGQFWPSVVLPSVLKLQRRDGAYELWQQAGQPLGKDENSTTKPRRSCNRHWIKKTSPGPRDAFA
jgi:hypothetical protein